MAMLVSYIEGRPLIILIGERTAMSYGVPALNILADRPGADEVSAALPSPQPAVPLG